MPYRDSIFTIQSLDGSMSARSDVYYLWGDFTLVFMFSRCFFGMRAILNNTPVMSAYAQKMAKHFGFEGGVGFAFKANLKEYPARSMLITLILTTFLLGSVLKVTEWPWGYANGNTVWAGYSSACWCTLITMTTVGYGDIYPVTFPGRCTAMIIAIWGAFMISLLIGSVDQVFELAEVE
jgi:hypothetical protein